VPTRVLFLADQFADSPRDHKSRYPGGAELTDDALIRSCPWPIERVRIRELKSEQLAEFDLHMLGNLRHASRAQCRTIAEYGRHVLFEHDYRICRWRGDFAASTSPYHRRLWRCNCLRRRWSAVFENALGAIFLTHRQLNIYRTNPFVKLPRSAVLGCSVMGSEFFDAVARFRANGSPAGAGTCVIYSGHSTKGYEHALAYCRASGIEPIVIRNATPQAVLQCFEKGARLVFLPQWPEPASRVAVEARFLGCEIVSNDALGVAGESWWHASDPLAFDFVREAACRFWELAESFTSGKVRPGYAWNRPNCAARTVFAPNSS
jgi:hypothetical protein